MSSTILSRPNGIDHKGVREIVRELQALTPAEREERRRKFDTENVERSIATLAKQIVQYPRLGSMVADPAVLEPIRRWQTLSTDERKAALDQFGAASARWRRDQAELKRTPDRATASAHDSGAAAPPKQWEADGPQDEPEKDPDPIDIFGSLTPEPILTPDMLPDLIRGFATDTAERLGVTLATVAIPALAVCASAIHGALTIQPKRLDTGYQEVPILWTEGIGDPGMRKTQALSAVSDPLERIDQEWREKDADLIRRYERNLALYKRQIQDWDRAHAQGKAEGPEPAEPTRPPKRQLMTTDYTIEKLGEILEDNPRGTLIKIDELSFLYGSFDAYRAGKASKDRPALLELFDGKRRVIDRLGYSRVVPHWGAGIVGNIQEDKLANLARSLTDDGLMQRFLVYRVGKTGMGEDRTPDRLAGERYECLIGYLAKLEPTGRPITLSEGAHTYREEIERLTEALSGNPMVSPALRGHAAKLHGIFARLLLLMHVIDHYQSNSYLLNEADFQVVQPDTAKRARDLMVEFVIPSAMSIYADYFRRDACGSDARWIAGHILAHKLDQITGRDLNRATSHHDMKDDQTRRDRAMRWLVDAGWASVNNVSRVDSQSWTINPRVHVLNSARAELEARQRKETMARIAKQGELIRQTYSR